MLFPRPRNIILLSLFIPLILSDPGKTQTTNTLQLSFRQDFNSYLWRTRFFRVIPLKNKHRLVLSEIYNADLLQSSVPSDKWKDDHLFTLNYLYDLTPWIRAGSLVRSKIFADRQTGFLNDFSTHLFAAGWIASPTRKLEIRNYLGWKSDRRYDRTSNGLFYQIQSASLPFEVEKYSNQFMVDFQRDNFRGRRNRDFLFNYRLSRQFYTNTSDSLNVQVGYRKKTYFISETGDLETRIERETNLTNWLSYQISPSILWNLSTRVYSRSSSVDQVVEQTSSGRREKDDRGTDWESLLRFRLGGTRSGIGMRYSSHDQSYSSSISITPSPFIGSIGIPDNRGRTFAGQAYLHWAPSSKDSLTTRITISRFRYDTPDSNNFDDRDEFRSSMLLGYERRFSPSLEIGVESKAYLHHLVYLFSERSANNNWNRIIQLGTYLRFRPTPGLTWFQRAEVQANYTTFDFEDLQFRIRSFVYRKFTIIDSIRIGRQDNFQFRLFHRMELEENGQLFWKTFSEQLLLNRRNHYLTFGCQYPIIDNLMAHIAVTGYLRREWRFKPSSLGNMIKEKQKDFLSYGPQVRLSLPSGRRRQASVSISRLHVSTPSGQSYAVNQVDLNAHWQF
jgi:hypothetical protein